MVKAGVFNAASSAAISISLKAFHGISFYDRPNTQGLLTRCGKIDFKENLITPISFACTNICGTACTIVVDVY